MLTWVVTLYDNATEPRRRARLPSLPRLTTIPNRKCRCVQHRHPERPTEVEGPLLIANLELEIQITTVFPITSIFLTANILRFFWGIDPQTFSPSPWPLIETPRLEIRINHPISITSNFLYRDKIDVLPCLLAPLCFFASLHPCLPSVSPCLRGQSLR